MKKNLSSEAQHIWDQILGTKGYLSSTRTQALVDILNRELGLTPCFIRRGLVYEPIDLPRFLALRIRDYPDGHFSVYYHPHDCEVATGSSKQNWLQWAATLLDYGHSTHPLAPKMKPPHEVQLELSAAGLSPNISRFLSLEVAVFYLAAQTKTWENQGRILTVKDFIQKHDINTLVDASHSDPVDALFPGTPKAKKPRLPTKGKSLMGYKPKEPESATQIIARVLGCDVDPNLSVVTNFDPESLTTEELSRFSKKLQIELEAKQQQELKAKLLEEAAKATLIHDKCEVFTNEPKYRRVTLRYPNGKEVVYVSQGDTST